MSSPPTNFQRLLSYTKLLTCHVKDGRHEQALSLFQHLHSSLRLDPFAFPLVLKSCTASNRPRLGSSVHALALKLSFSSNPFVACGLIGVYGKCVSVSDARKLFDESTERTVVVWNAMISMYSGKKEMGSALCLFERMDCGPDASTFNSIISGFFGVENGSVEAVTFCRKMQDAGLRPNLITLLALLRCSVGIADLNVVKQIHGFSVRNSIDPHFQFRSGLVEAYGRCGCLGYALFVFRSMNERDVVAWSSLISAYALHGEAKFALQVFERMEASGVKPDEITFLAVLKACTHAGLADEARNYFTRMMEEFGLEPSSEHYSCLVDALSRTGRLYEAYEVIQGMTVKVTACVWGALLGACRTYGEVEIAEVAARALFQVEPHNTANYVLLSKVYSSAGRHEEANKIITKMKERGLTAAPGSSWFMYQE